MGGIVNNDPKVKGLGQTNNAKQIPKSMEFTAPNSKCDKAGYAVKFLSDYKYIPPEGYIPHEKLAKITGTVNWGGIETKLEGYLSKNGRLYVKEACSTPGSKFAFPVPNKMTGEDTNYMLETEVPKEVPAKPKPVITQTQSYGQDSYEPSAAVANRTATETKQTETATPKVEEKAVGAEGKKTQVTENTGSNYKDSSNGQTFAEAVGEDEASTVK